MSKELKESVIDFDPETGRMRSSPQQLFVEVSSRCNLTCVHCPTDYGSDVGPPRIDLALETAQRMVPWFRDARFVNLNVVGEPMLSPHLHAIIAMCVEGKAEVSFNTNGVLLKRANCEMLIDGGVRSIAVSIDGQDSLPAIRGITYKALRRRLVEFDEAKRRAGSSTPHLAITWAMMNRNALELPKVLRDLLPAIDVHAVHVQPLVIYYETLRGENAYDSAVVGDAVDEAREIAAQHGVHFSVFRSTANSDERNQDEGLGQLGQHSQEYGCIDPFYEIKIRSTGEVMACSYGLMPDFHVQDMELDEIWNHEWYCELRKRLYAKRFTGPCEHCPYVHGCSENQLDSLRPGVHHSQEARFQRGGYGRREPLPTTYPSVPFNP